jgi:hypothetical protein
VPRERERFREKHAGRLRLLIDLVAGEENRQRATRAPRRFPLRRD